MILVLCSVVAFLSITAVLLSGTIRLLYVQNAQNFVPVMPVAVLAARQIH